MKFQNIPADTLTIRIKWAANVVAALQEQAVFSVKTNSSRSGEFELLLKNALVSVRPVVDSDIRRLSAELASGRAMLAQLANPAVDGSIELQIVFFTGACLEMGDVDIGVDEYVESAMGRIERHRDRLKGGQLCDGLDSLCCFQHGGNTFFFLTAGPAIDEALQPNNVPTHQLNSDEEEVFDESNELGEDAAPDTVFDNANQASVVEPTRKNSFCVTGDGIRFVATETPVPGGKTIFLATRLTKNKNVSDRALRLVKGKLRFVDWTKAGQIQVLAKAQMAELTQDSDSYLKKWDEFGDLEGELLLQQARKVNALQYCNMVQQRDGTVSVELLNAPDVVVDALERGDVPAVEVVDELPDYLQDEHLTFKDFANNIEKTEENSPQESKKYFEVLGIDRDAKTLTLKAEILPNESGILIRSLAGEVAQIKRRMNARRMILEGRAANPQLGLLIEEKGHISPTHSTQKIPPLTAFVRQKIFNNPPTVMQEKAVEVALNTPDMALIQGPPGTGKTTVIAAILERLNEMADKRGVNSKGQVLLTGFQHDAVENMIERLSLSSIPVPKFGKRSGAEEDDYNVFERKLEDWCSERASELRERNPQIVEVEQETEIKNLCLQYIQMPTRVLATHLAGKIASLGVSILGEDGVRQAANLAKKLLHEEKLNDDSRHWLDAVRRLRIRPESFADDGPERAADALVDLSDVLEKNEQDLLDRASLWRAEDPPPLFLSELAELKKALLVRFTTPPVFRVEKQNDEVVTLAEFAIKRIKVTGCSARDKKSAALVEFLAELENNPYGMIDAVSEYSFAFAATCQQSVNWGMQIQKGISGPNVDDNQKWMEYEYVIVDEAARVSPRDLMIPMAQGKRIILVGDHRQLPHIIDDEVASQMEAGETGQDESDWLKKSMFQYLFSERLKTLEENDGICRRVTLDKQYRMHPLLGDFISRNFYECFDSREKFSSGRPASDFAHDLFGMNGKPTAWLDVPAEKGKHKRVGTSWTRPAEASVIARQLQEWMASDAGKELSFGVISFYKAQAELIKRQLGNITADDKKLRIGTVDSFQGMEFDVVFLSMVRTLPSNWKPQDGDREKQARGLFGHLCLYNRLNVSMSRQKKLLIVAGDSELLQNELAAEFVPGLVDFFKLCREEGVMLPC